MNICPTCHAQLVKDNQLFCIYCGNALPAQPQMPVANPIPQMPASNPIPEAQQTMPQAVPEQQPVPQQVAQQPVPAPVPQPVAQAPVPQPVPVQQAPQPVPVQQPVPQPMPVQQAYTQPVQPTPLQPPYAQPVPQQYPQQQYPQQAQPMAPQPAAAPVSQPTTKVDSLFSRVFFLLCAIATCSVGFMNYYSLPDKKFSAYDLFKWVFDLADKSKKIGLNNDGMEVAKFMVAIAAVFFILAFVGVIAGIFDIVGSNKKKQMFWTNLSGGVLGAFMGNWFTFFMVEAVNAKTKDITAEILNKVIKVDNGFYGVQFFIFILFAITVAYRHTWKKENQKALAQNRMQ